MLTIDGSQGEGGGQVLRSSLALAVATGTKVRVENIRAGRRKPGLLRQHLTCVQAAAQISNGQISGAELGSTAIELTPGPVQAGDYHFSIGTAGSTTLVLQAILPPLLIASGESRVRVEGGTHNPMAPPYEFLERALLPALGKAGVRCSVRLIQPGFYPAGGGALEITVPGDRTSAPFEMIERGNDRQHSAQIVLSDLPGRVAERERQTLLRKLRWSPSQVRVSRFRARGPGNVVSLILESENITEVVTAYGSRGTPAEEVAASAAREAQAYLKSSAPVGIHLADQLMVPLAILGGGRFRTLPPTSHTTTNAGIVGAFLGEDAVTLNQDGDTTLIEVRATASR